MKKYSKNYFYEKNVHLLKSDLNILWEDIVYMSDEEFRDWVIKLRKFVVETWNTYGCPPVVGSTEREIIQDLRNMESFPVHKELPGTDDYGDPYIRCTNSLGLVINQWFPTMMRTRINTNSKGNGISIYDNFAEDKYLKRCITLLDRNFKRDSYYIFSRKVLRNNSEEFLFACETGKEWIKKFEEQRPLYKKFDYWLQSAKDRDEKGYAGYLQNISMDFLTITKQEVEELGDLIPEKVKLNIKNSKEFNDKLYIRLFEKKSRIFPKGYIAFKTSLGQYAVNFPPLIAKFLYEKYTEDIKDQEIINIYDPSCGWAGRILGAMSVKDDRRIHYIGTDPNKDHTIIEGDKTYTKYENIADYYNSHKCALPGFTQNNTYHIFQLGSEVIKDDPEFQQYKGKIDLVFTSPPYFIKEAYSEDAEQSCHKFPGYQDWIDGFLKMTLQTAVEWLKYDRYLLWNIADARFDGNILPLEEESNKILKELGMEFVRMEKMILAQAPGGNRVIDGKPSAKNSTKINGRWFKFEPVFVWKKVKNKEIL